MKKRYIMPIITIIIILILTIILSAIYLTYLRKLTRNNTLKNLGELTKQNAAKIENTIQEHKRILETITNEIEIKKPKLKEEIFKIFERNSGRQKFSRIAIMYKDGKTITNDGETLDLSQNKEEFFKTNNTQISQSKKSQIDNQEINIYSKKITWNNEEVVILLSLDTDKYEEIFSQSIYNGNSYEYIITNEGQIIANSKNEPNGQNIIKKLEESNKENKNQNLKTIEKIQKDIKNNSNGQTIYFVNGLSYYTAYQKLQNTNWYLIVFTQGKIIAEELNKILELTFIIAIIIIFILLIITTYIIITSQKQKEKLYKLAYIDKITKLGNYNLFLEEGKKFLSKYRNNNYSIILDIDKFKSFNKKYGHNTGNKLLKKIGDILKETLNNKAIICRLSNDLFGILLNTKKDIKETIEKITTKLSKIKIQDMTYTIYISIGIYKILENEYNIKKILDKTLIAHDEIKGNYNKKYKMYDKKVEEKIEREHELESIMQEAIEKEEFKIYYQPKISTKTNQMVSAEALVRWERNEKMISTTEFIKLFEKNQFIITLDKYVYEKVCIDISKWKKKIKNIPLISVNISKEHFIKKDFIKEYKAIAKKHGIKPEELEIEITESALISENTNYIKVVEEIKKEGFIVSIDDFGTGYSSLSILQNMPIDIIKIDKTFIDKIDFDKKGNNLVDYIILIAKKLNLKTVAEGVENEEQVKYLKEIDCDLLQGYYYSKPLESSQYEKLLV